MRFIHPEHAGRAVRVAYCMNLHAAETRAELFAGLREITLPLAARLPGAGSFGVGMYLPGRLARELARDEVALSELRDVLAEGALDPFTFNAFPFGGFHRSGLKRAVFEPTWAEPARADYTLDVAHCAARLGAAPRITLSTHPGRFGPWAEGERAAADRELARVVRGLAEVEEAGGPRLVLCLEAEPRAVAGTTAEVATQLEALRERLRPELGEALDAHLALCFDTCHAAVEFEEPRTATRAALDAGLGKVQVSSALRLREPAAHPAARAALLDLDEPRYLHQTTGRRGDSLVRVDDLPELAAVEAREAWLACEEWRTHFHVPLDLERLGDSGLETTRGVADVVVDTLLADPSAWTTPELQLELETYTWDILPRAARGVGELVDGLEREYQHLLARLTRAGWRRAA